MLLVTVLSTVDSIQHAPELEKHIEGQRTAMDWVSRHMCFSHMKKVHLKKSVSV